MEIRAEHAADVAAIRDVNTRAFNQADEADIVDQLRSNGAFALSLVALVDDRIVGHILYSPVEIASEGVAIEGVGLGPMAVLPEFQRRGIGSRLVDAGNEQIKQAGWPFAVVLGHPGFYPRFGFRPARPLGVTCKWNVPDDVFMMMVFDPAAMQGVSGSATYRP